MSASHHYWVHQLHRQKLVGNCHELTHGLGKEGRNEAGGWRRMHPTDRLDEEKVPGPRTVEPTQSQCRIWE